jgi:uncharacterized protein YdhG (YjbR/CyaY superfamily)
MAGEFQESDPMDASQEHGTTIDEYIATFPADVQVILEQMRQAIREAAPDATETISYRMPAFKINGQNLVYFAAFKHHIGFYPVPSGMDAFKQEISSYKQGKGSVQFPLDKPVPLGLVKKIVRFRVAENKKTGRKETKKIERD